MERRFLGIEELEAYLGISKNTIYFWVWQRKIPHLKLGRLIKFDLRELEPWLEEKRKKQMI